MGNEDLTQNTQPVDTQQPVSGETKPEDAAERYAKLYGDEDATQAPKYTQDDINRALYEEILALRSLVESIRQPSQRQEPSTAPTPPQAPTGTLGPKSAWLEKLRDGRFDEGTDELVRTVVNQLEASGYLGALQSQAAARSLDAVRAENELMRYVESVKASKPHLAQMEDFITARVQNAIMDAYQTGRIGSISEWVETFKSVLDKEVERAESLYQKIRASGVPDVAQMKNKVASGAVVVPTGGSKRDVTSPTHTPQTVEDYIAQRKAEQLRRAGFNTRINQ